MENEGIAFGERPVKDARPADSPSLSGWAGVEAHVAEDDEGKMKGYSEDIDTLLVFAGLFSAILTAFVVQTYPLLQPSSTDVTNQLLAANNRMLVQGFSAVIAQAITSTSPIFLVDELPPFQASASARWINSLFFISLVLSLAAALFGILAKQWVREYMQWNSPLASPRENVLVRQFRFKEWESWNVAIVISTVPALLEVAMILFLMGMIILLWTLDDVVAICVTAVTSIFLLVVAVFTILPVCSRRCPYKSPTAWALVVACNLMSFPVLFCGRWVKSYLARVRRQWRYRNKAGTLCRRWRGMTRMRATVRSRSYSALCSVLYKFYFLVEILYLGSIDDIDLEREPHEHVPWRPLPRGWRDLDLRSLQETKYIAPWWLEFQKAQSRLPHAPLMTLGQSAEEEAAMLVDAGETKLLLEALTWVTKSSQDTRITAYIEQCSQVEHHQHEHGLHSLHLLLDQVVRSREDRRLGADEWWLFILQFILRGIKCPVSSGLLLRAYTEAIQNYRLTLSPAGHLVVSGEDFTKDSDYELLLVKYFDGNFRRADEDRLHMFVATAGLWLSRRSVSQVPSEVMTPILEKMVNAAEALSVVSGAPALVVSGAPLNAITGTKVNIDHLDWIWKLSGERQSLTRMYGVLYRRLLHALERAYNRDMLHGDQDAIRKSLHIQLETTHAPGVACEVPKCPWSGHGTHGDAAGQYHMCHLLFKRIDTVSLARLRWARTIRIVRNIVRMRQTSRFYLERLRRQRLRAILRRAVHAVIFIHRLARLIERSPPRIHIPPMFRASPLRRASSPVADSPIDINSAAGRRRLRGRLVTSAAASRPDVVGGFMPPPNFTSVAVPEEPPLVAVSMSPRTEFSAIGAPRYREAFSPRIASPQPTLGYSSTSRCFAVQDPSEDPARDGPVFSRLGSTSTHTPLPSGLRF